MRLIIAVCTLELRLALSVPGVGDQLSALLPQCVEAVEVLRTLSEQGLGGGGLVTLIIVAALIVWLVDLNLDLKYKDGFIFIVKCRRRV